MNENNNNNSLPFENNDEILENPKSNSFNNMPSIQSKQKPPRKKKSNAFYYIFYLSIIISIYVLFFINYLKTKNWYEENTHYINLRPISICQNYIKSFENCLNSSQKSTLLLKKEGNNYIYDTKIICKEYNDKLQGCFDNVHHFSQRCQLYLNELDLCKNKYGKEIKKCLTNNLISCWKAYNFINITKVFEDL